MNYTIFTLSLAFFLIIAIVLQMRYFLMLDTSTATPRPYSFARWQLVWWTFIVLAAFMSIILASGQIPTLNNSTLILLGIGSITAASAKIIDISDKQSAAAPVTLSVNQPSQGFLLDILSDCNGISIQRLQAFIFNLVFGVWFIYKVYTGIQGAFAAASADKVSSIIPEITPNNLILLGLSSGTYVAMKTAENK